VSPEIAARLAACEIALAAQAQDYCMFVRGNCVALVRTESGRFTSMGSTGMLTEKGLAYLVWHDGKAWLSSHGSELQAETGQVDEILRFSKDLKKTISLP
jgi:hypothetical protein